MKTIQLESTTIEPLTVTIRATADPTGEDVEFVTTDETATDPAGTWQAGTWGAYTNSVATATTPTFGASGAAIEVAEGDRLTLWCRVGTIVRKAARIIVT